MVFLDLKILKMQNLIGQIFLNYFCEDSLKKNFSKKKQWLTKSKI